jgi:hypothetical protein
MLNGFSDDVEKLEFREHQCVPTWHANHQSASVVQSFVDSQMIGFDDLGDASITPYTKF